MNIAAWASSAAFFLTAIFRWHYDAISAVMLTFFGVIILRKFTLDGLLRRSRA